jgi:all-trans-retinol 13,14-reductase
MIEPGGWDAICVGAGITSLAFGAQVVQRHPSARILVIDKHSVPGGYATVFERPKAGAVFDCSLHKLSGMGEGGNLQRIFAELGLDEALSLKYPDDYFEACLPGRSFKLGNDVEEFRQILSREFPHEQAGLDRFFDEVAVHGRNGYYQFQMMEGSFEADFSQLRYAHKHLKNVTVAQALAERIQDSELRDILAATGVYVGGYPEDLGYLYFLHVLYATLSKGNAYVEGASQRLSNVLAQRIVDAGGQVMLGTTVQKVVNDADGRVCGVRTSRGEFHADRVYLNASPHYAMQTLFDGAPEFEPVVRKLEKLKPSRSTTTIYLTTDVAPAELGLDSTETMIFARGADAGIEARTRSAQAGEEACEQAYWRESVMEVTNYHALDPAGGRIVCLNVLDSIDHWPDRKSSEYKPKKARARDALLERLYQAKPGVRGHVVYAEVSTPRTYMRFTNNTDGAGYGAMVGTDLSGHVFHHGFPVSGVHFLSAWVAGPSYEAAFGYAEMKAKQWTM